MGADREPRHERGEHRAHGVCCRADDVAQVLREAELVDQPGRAREHEQREREREGRRSRAARLTRTTVLGGGIRGNGFQAGAPYGGRVTMARWARRDRKLSVISRALQRDGPSKSPKTVE